MDILKNFGENLKKYRLQKKVTQEELAFKAKLSVYYISKLEQGRTNPSLETISKLAKALGVKVSQMLD